MVKWVALGSTIIGLFTAAVIDLESGVAAGASIFALGLLTIIAISVQSLYQPPVPSVTVPDDDLIEPFTDPYAEFDIEIPDAPEETVATPRNRRRAQS
jgi:hypothetical protein